MYNSGTSGCSTPVGGTWLLGALPHLSLRMLHGLKYYHVYIRCGYDLVQKSIHKMTESTLRCFALYSEYVQQ